MDDNAALEIANQIFQMVFDCENPYSLDELFQKFAQGVRLPFPVKDFIAGDETWSTAAPEHNFITNANMAEIDQTSGWLKPAQSFGGVNDILDAYREINSITTERVYDSLQVAKSDTIYGCENVYRSTDCRACSNIIYTASCGNSEYLLGCERSANCNFCIGVSDSGNCSNSYQVVCSSKILNSLFVQDCFDLYECMFCAHLASRKYCVANVELDQAEYYRLKPLVIEWILQGGVV